MRLSRIITLIHGVVLWSLTTIHGQINYEESLAGSHPLPDPLRFEDGTAVGSAVEWTGRRRHELLRLFEDCVYGVFPPRPRMQDFRIVRRIPNALDGLETRLDIALWISPDGESPVLRFTAWLPADADGPVPAFAGVHLFDTSRDFPSPAVGITSESAQGEKALWAGMETGRAILRQGFALISLDIDALAPDGEKRYRTGALSQLRAQTALEAGRPESGALGVWAWGLARVVDYAETDPHLDGRKVIAMGHSRMGKAALWAAANDQRIAMVISNNSGCGGAALSRRNFGESPAHICRVFPYWFSSRFSDYSPHPETLPVDQHQLLALTAPRPVYVASASEDRWADPKGEYLSLFHAQPVYHLLGVKSQLPQEWEPVAHAHQGPLGYHLRNGAHNLTTTDWKHFLNFASGYFRP